MSRGQMWIVQEIDKALRQYEVRLNLQQFVESSADDYWQECMRAQIAILHYQTHAKRL